VVKVRVSPVVVVGLLQHHPVSRSGVEDLLEHQICNVRDQCNHRQDDSCHIGLRGYTGIPDFSCNLRLENEGDVGGVQNHSRDVVES